jgi:hypothetical protein
METFDGTPEQATRFIEAWLIEKPAEVDRALQNRAQQVGRFDNVELSDALFAVALAFGDVATWAPLKATKLR